MAEQLEQFHEHVAERRVVTLEVVAARGTLLAREPPLGHERVPLSTAASARRLEMRYPT